jgi:phosphoribosyl 1,2-cyclic phosphodiesterase
MSLNITSLNSGSNGNCYYIGNEQEAILIDAGLTCRETEKRMLRLNLKMSKVKAIFISHEHGDHIKGLDVIAHKFSLPVYITGSTLRGCPNLKKELAVNFSAHEPINIGGLSVIAFPKSHDAADPHSFIISCGGVTIGVFTDIGVPCINLQNYFKQCDAAFLEANYDEQMLDGGRYPYFLKNRIRGGQGHLSNKQALELFISHRPPMMSHLLLAHLSKDNNCPDLALELFRQHAGRTKVVVASRYEETPVFRISKEDAFITPIFPVNNPTQLAFF